MSFNDFQMAIAAIAESAIIAYAFMKAVDWLEHQSTKKNAHDDVNA